MRHPAAPPRRTTEVKNLIGRPVRLTAPMFVTAAMFVAAGGYVHLRDWLNLYRHLPADSAGAAVVRVGFPINAALSLVLASALVVCALRMSRLAPLVGIAAALFQVGSLAMLIATRTGTVVGWTEPTWTGGPSVSRAVEIGALLSLSAIGVLASNSAVTGAEPFGPRSQGTADHPRHHGAAATMRRAPERSHCCWPARASRTSSFRTWSTSSRLVNLGPHEGC